MTENRAPDRFGALIDVDLREAWPHEATDFTPWLADNLDRIAEVIGVQMEPEGVEVEVGDYQADVLARDTSHRRVLIENQLERSDHSHLGQILTYLAGLEARTVIWIARDFSDAHLSAVRWLNENAGDDEDRFDFFALKLRVVRIDDSRFAPIFEVAERPIDWDRRVHDATHNVALMDESTVFRLEFWHHYARRHPDAPAITEGYRNRAVWDIVESVEIVISMMLSKRRVGISYRPMFGEQTADAFERIKNRADDIRRHTGIELGSATHPWCWQEKQFEATDRSDWDEIADWLHEKLVRYRRGLVGDP